MVYSQNLRQSVTKLCFPSFGRMLITCRAGSQSGTGTSPTAGPPTVPQWDPTRPTAGHYHILNHPKKIPMVITRRRRTRTTPSEGEFGIISTRMGKGITESTVEEIKRLVEKV